MKRVQWTKISRQCKPHRYSGDPFAYMIRSEPVLNPIITAQKERWGSVERPKRYAIVLNAWRPPII